MQANYDDALRWLPKDFNSNYAAGSEAEMYSHYIPRVFSQNMHYMPPTTIPYTKPVAVGTVEVNPAGVPRGFANYGGRTQSYESFAQWRQQVQQCVHSTGQSARSSNNRVPGINKDQEEKKDGEDSWGLLDAQAAFLGPTLWDKNLLYDADVKCEFMDLDEFLMENGIPINDGSSSNAPSNTNSPAPLLPTVIGASPASSHGEALCSPADNHSVKSNLLSPNATTAVPTPSTSSEREALSFDDGDSNFSHSSMASSRISSSYDCEPAANTSRPRRTTRKAAKDLSTAMVESVPGHDFDPRERAFTDDELKPQPMSKKSRKQLVPDEQKDDRYWARRRKNNMAAKRSRDARRLKENQIVIRASYLERENTVLKMELERMRKENEMLRERLSKKK